MDQGTDLRASEAAPALVTATATVRGWRRLPQAALDATMRVRAVEHLAGRVLVVAPHPDDETLGCGGTILRSTDAGQAVHIAFATDGSGSHARFVDPDELAARRRAEALAAAAVLGVGHDRVHFLGFDDGSLRARQDAVATALAALAAELRPDHVLVPSRLDQHRDHLAARDAAWAAVRRSGRQTEILEYPVWFWHHWPWIPLAPTGNGRSMRRTAATAVRRRLGLQLFTEFRYAVDVGGVLDRKGAALACHETQVTRPADAPGWPILDDVADGLFVDRFFQRYEIFRRCPVVPTPGRSPAMPPSAAPGTGPATDDADARVRPDAHPPPVPYGDDFAEDVPAGKVLGTGSARRLGVDAEGRISIDHGALRFEPLHQPGWGRQAIAYGPFDARPGLTVAFYLLNGHNCSQTDRPAPGRALRWAKAARVLLGRLRHRVMAGRRDSPPGAATADTVSIPPRALEAHRTAVDLRDNLILGWLDKPDGDRPDGPRFVVHATRTHNGELRAGHGQVLALFDGLQNLPMYYVVTLRSDGAAFYVSSMPGARGPGPYPHLRPVALTSATVAETVFAGLQQSILGEVGYRAATRVYGVRVAHLPAWGDRYGTAIAADAAPAAGQRAQLGGTWHEQADGSLRLEISEAVGLVRLRLQVTGAQPRFVVRWREATASQCLELLLTADGATVAIRDDDQLETLAQCDRGSLAPNGGHELQILDDGATISAHVDGELLFDQFVSVGEERSEEAAAFAVAAVDVDVVDVEAHPRLVALPSGLDMGGPAHIEGTTVVVADDFMGDAGELDGRWERSLGAGHIDYTGSGGARVRADRNRPNPGRTLYTIPWHDPGFTDIEAEITPPGDRRGIGHACRGGLCLWQDPENYLVVNLWLADSFPGSSVSSFLRIDGREGFYDPVWSNVGRAVEPGRPVRLRVVSDGGRYVVHLQREPVLYRAFSDIYPDADRFDIRRVGLAANWEWGDDTGSMFRELRARAR